MISADDLVHDRAGNPTSRVYVSPHFDDVAFSLGGFVGRNPGGVLINCFTRGNFNAREGSGKLPTYADIEATRAIRMAEDKLFSEACGLERVDLMCDEPMLRGRRPRSGEGLEEDVAQLEPLFGQLIEIADRLPGRRILFSPAAIGDHINHMATFEYIRRHLAELEKHYTIVFYEELPYARSPRPRARHVARTKDALAPRRIERIAMRTTNARQKVVFVRGYATQHSRAPITLRRFTPGTLSPFGWHEAMWAFA